MNDLRGELVSLANELGRPEHDYAILGEGNVSARIDASSFWVTTSGAELRTSGPEQLARIDRRRALSMLDAGDLDDDAVRGGLERAMLDPRDGVLPSVETVVHAVFLELDGVEFVGHTHPSVVNMLTCALGYQRLLSGSLFPDEIVICGPVPMLVPYVDPGLPLARDLRVRLAEHIREHGERPKVVYLQNHGLVALGATPKQVLDITAMAVKGARIRAGAAAAGGINVLTQEAAERIHTRPDEHYRQRLLRQG